MVSQAATDKIFYEDTLAWARETGRADLVDTLEASGPPPYADVRDYEAALIHEQEVYPYDHSANSEGAGQMSENIFVEEYTLLEQMHILGATLDVFSVLYPQLQEIDFRTQATTLDVPVYLAQGRHEAPGRQLLAREWFERLRAPSEAADLLRDLRPPATVGAARTVPRPDDHGPGRHGPDVQDVAMTRRDRRRAGWVLTTALALALAGAAGAAGGATGVRRSPGDGQPPDGRTAHVQRVLAEELDESGIPGGAFAVVSDRQIEAGGAGSAGGDRQVAADTPFVIGSASKSFTALAVMQLVDAGRVDLEAPVREYVPELRLAAGQPVDDITVRHLLQQTSGLDDLAGGPLLASAADGTPLEAVAELEDAELASAPGQTWRYANVNYVLAGLVVERASGLSYGDYVQREIFAPLGMTHSSASTDPVANDSPADGHRFWFGVPVATEPTRRDATLAAGYLTSSAARPRSLPVALPARWPRPGRPPPRLGRRRPVAADRSL